MHVVGLAVVDGDPVAKHFGASVRRAWIEGRGFALGDFLNQAKHLRRGRLVEADLLATFVLVHPDGFQKFDGTHGHGVHGVHRHIKRHSDV